MGSYSVTILEGFGSNLFWNYPSLGPELVAIVISAKPMPAEDDFRK